MPLRGFIPAACPAADFHRRALGPHFVPFVCSRETPSNRHHCVALSRPVQPCAASHGPSMFDVRCSMFDVRCSMFPNPQGSAVIPPFHTFFAWAAQSPSSRPNLQPPNPEPGTTSSLHPIPSHLVTFSQLNSRSNASLLLNPQSAIVNPQFPRILACPPFASIFLLSVQHRRHLSYE
ncbi:MAG: hypothetical protein JWQ04_2462 [Pedosphaera sp.]|nr:hypothetical protein [Pedosphaera sp.]